MINNKIIKYIWSLISLIIFALSLSLFQNANAIKLGYIKLIVDIFTIIGYGATTIGVVLAIKEFNSWKKVKKYEQKLDGLQKLLSSTHSLYAKHGRLVQYLRLLQANKGIKNPPLTYDKLIKDLTEVNLHNDEVSHLLATEISIFDEKPNEIFSKVFPGINQGNVLCDKILDKMVLPEGTQIVVKDWLAIINTEDTIACIELWYNKSEETQGHIETLNEYTKETVKKMLK